MRVNRRQSVAHAEETLLTTSVDQCGKVHEETALSLRTHISSSKDFRWDLDSGATTHMCHNKSLFVDLRPVLDQDVRLATDKMIKIHGSGTVCLNV